MAEKVNPVRNILFKGNLLLKKIKFANKISNGVKLSMPKLPKIKLPKFKLPTIRMPRLRLPKFRLPRLKLPAIKLPKLRLPKLRLPRIKLPAIRLPKLRLPKFKLPSFRFSKVRLPRIRLPKIRLPRLKLPSIRMPKVKLPEPKLPKVKLPTIKPPQIKLPAVKLPKIKLPRINAAKYLKYIKAVLPGITIAIIAALLIFLFIRFISAFPRNTLEISEAPPVVSQQPPILAEPVVTATDSSSFEEKAQPVEEEVRPAPPIPEFTNTYTIQIAVYNFPSYAERTVNNLKRKGYDAEFYETTSSSGATRYRIYVGKFGSRQETESVLEGLKNEGFPDAFVRRIKRR